MLSPGRDGVTFRLALGGLEHETNQYVAFPTTLAHFRVTRGKDIITGDHGRTYLGGMLAAACDLGADVVGTLHAAAPPWGTIEGTTYLGLKDELLTALKAALPVDAVALALHGAGVVDGLDDLEGDLCAAVRSLVGPDVPIVVTHDLHGNVTQAEADATDLMFGVHHYPHDDMYERGREAIESIPLLLNGHWHPTTHVERLPLLLPTTTTYLGAGAQALELCRQAEDDDAVIDCTFMHGFPYTDNSIVGSQVVVTTNDDPEHARYVARKVAAAIWALREQFVVQHLLPAEAVSTALATDGRPVVINETSDNAGGGSPCDGTHLLRALLAAKPVDAVFVGIKDPDVVRQATDAGIGTTIDIRLGGKTDRLHGDPIDCTAYVKTLTDGETRLEAPTGKGWRYPLGPTARLVIDGVDVIVISEGMQTIDRTPLLLHGIDPLDRKLVALKSSQHFRSGFQDLAAAIITTDPPGLTTLQLDQLPRSRSPRPLFPLDADAAYPEEPPR